MASLAEQLRSLSNPEPSRFDLDEDEFDLTRAQVVNKETNLGDIENQTVSNTSVLRKKTLPILEDEDQKYAGRKISRAQLEASRDHVEGSDGEEESKVESDSEGMRELHVLCDEKRQKLGANIISVNSTNVEHVRASCSCTLGTPRLTRIKGSLRTAAYINYPWIF